MTSWATPGSMTAWVPKKSAASRIWCGMIMASFWLPSTKTGGSSAPPSTGWWVVMSSDFIGRPLGADLISSWYLGAMARV